MGLLQAIERLLGRRSHRPTTSVWTAGSRIPDGAVDLARATRAMIRDPVELEPPGPELTGLSTDDVDPETGKRYPDYFARRKAREEDRHAAKENRIVGTFDNWKP